VVVTTDADVAVLVGLAFVRVLDEMDVTLVVSGAVVPLPFGNNKK
jgi:hypothetical protein